MWVGVCCGVLIMVGQVLVCRCLTVALKLVRDGSVHVDGSLQRGLVQIPVFVLLQGHPKADAVDKPQPQQQQQHDVDESDVTSDPESEGDSDDEELGLTPAEQQQGQQEQQQQVNSGKQYGLLGNGSPTQKPRSQPALGDIINQQRQGSPGGFMGGRGSAGAPFGFDM